MATPPWFEHGTTCLEGRCSIQLSYGATETLHNAFPYVAEPISGAGILQHGR